MKSWLYYEKVNKLLQDEQGTMKSWLLWEIIL